MDRMANIEDMGVSPYRPRELKFVSVSCGWEGGVRID